MSQLRLDMDMLQAKVKWLHKKGCNSEEIAKKVNISERSVRVIVKWLIKKIN